MPWNYQQLSCDNAMRRSEKNVRCAENEFLIILYKCVILSRFAYIKVVLLMCDEYFVTSVLLCFVRQICWWASWKVMMIIIMALLLFYFLHYKRILFFFFVNKKAVFWTLINLWRLFLKHFFILIFVNFLFKSMQPNQNTLTSCLHFTRKTFYLFF